MHRLDTFWFATTESLCLAATLLARQLFNRIPDSFSDIYMVAIIWVTYKCSWKWGLLALASSLVMSFYLLLPIDKAGVSTIVSLAISGIVIVAILRAAARRRES